MDGLAWAAEINGYELAQILREDNRFADLGRMLFALAEWGMEERELIGTLRGHRSTVTCVQFRPGAAQWASGGADGDIRIWDAMTDTCAQTLDGHANPVTALQWSADGSRLVAASTDSGVNGTIDQVISYLDECLEDASLDAVLAIAG